MLDKLQGYAADRCSEKNQGRQKEGKKSRGRGRKKEERNDEGGWLGVWGGGGGGWGCQEEHQGEK